MTISLYDATVGRFLQTLAAVDGFLERGRAHCIEAGVDPDELAQARLWSDMLPLSFQLISVAHHSRGAIEGVRKGVFSPPHRDPLGYAEMQALNAGAGAALKAVGRDEIDALQGRDVVFTAGERRIPFLAEGFLLSFSLPNFYFHAATAYDILRSRGVPLGKRDYLGQLSVKS